MISLFVLIFVGVKLIYNVVLISGVQQNGRGISPHRSSPDLERAVAPLSPPAVFCWSSHDEIPHVQGKRNPSKMVGAEGGHKRADRLKPQSQTTSQSDHMDRSLV